MNFQRSFFSHNLIIMKPSSRRNFLKSVSGITGATLIGLPYVTRGNSVSPVIKQVNKPVMRALGQTGIELPVVSMGVMNANNPNLVKEAWKVGIRHLDTAWVYQNGNNEKMIGNALREMNINRKEVIIATKFLLRSRTEGSLAGEKAKETLLSQLQDSLSRLQTNYIDILYIHDVSKPEQITDPEVMNTLKELKESGKIRFCGFTSHTYWPDLVNKAAGQKFYDVLLLAWNVAWSQDAKALEAMKNAYEAGIGIIAMKTQCQQDWYKQQLPAEAQKFYEGEVMHSALLKWVLRNEYITTAVPGFTTFQQLEEDLPVMSSLEYNGLEKQFLTDRNVKLAFNNICRHCGLCGNACPKKAEVPSLMRTHMYIQSYGNALLAKQTLGGIEKGKGLEVCRDCDSCTVKCVRNVQVGKRISELKEIYC